MYKVICTKYGITERGLCNNVSRGDETFYVKCEFNEIITLLDKHYGLIDRNNPHSDCVILKSVDKIDGQILKND